MEHRYKVPIINVNDKHFYIGTFFGHVKVILVLSS